MNAPDYLEVGDTMFYKTSNFFKITDGAVFDNYVFSWGDETSNVGVVSGNDIIVAHSYSIRDGAVDLIISADSSIVTLVDTIGLICSDEYPFDPVNLNQMVDTAYDMGNGYYYCRWLWLTAWNNDPVGTIQAHGNIGGSDNWTLIDANVINSVEHPGYMEVEIIAKNSNITPTPLGNIYWLQVHSINNQWFTVNAERMGGYYLDTVLNGNITIAIGFIFINGIPFPLSYSPQIPSGAVANNDAKIMEDQVNLYIDYSGILGENKFVRAINGTTQQSEDVSLTMYGGSMYAMVAKDSISFQSGGANWIMIRPGVDGVLLDITAWSLYNEDLDALVFMTPMNSAKSMGNHQEMATVLQPSPQEITQLVWELKYQDN
ncbi:TPA: hypothetical protein DCZ15_00860 [Candidatus Falkowbacteria bacterium]|nr:hypothetical protein [Candidatus Falkowbacteria bacterium]